MSVTVEQSDVFVKVPAVMCGVKHKFLIDSGASHNFISQSVLTRLGVHSHSKQRVRVRMADQNVVTTNQFLHVLL